MRVAERGAALKTESKATKSQLHSAAGEGTSATNPVAVVRSLARTHPRQVSPDDAEGTSGSSPP